MKRVKGFEQESGNQKKERKEGKKKKYNNKQAMKAVTQRRDLVQIW